MRSNILKLLITLNHQSLSFKTIRTSNTPFTYWNNQLKPLNEYSKLSIFQLCFMQNSCPDAYAIVPIMPTASAKLCLVVTGEKGWASQPASQQASQPASQPANYTKHTPRETLNRKGTFSMAFCGLRSVWMVFFVGAFDLRDGDSAQNLGAQIDQKWRQRWFTMFFT